MSKKTGKPGYAPACANKFVSGVCELPKVKCGECPNQAFIPFDDAAVLGHLTGRHVMGVYPLLEDETCWFLAVDFDKSTWMDDVRAFVETCRRVGLPAAVERSRSGNGAHVWFFFSEPVPAAHRAQDGLLPHHRDDVAAARAQHGLVRPALPEPGHDAARRIREPDRAAAPARTAAAGNSVFLDDELDAYPDDQQWAFLASVQRIDRGDGRADRRARRRARGRSSAFASRTRPTTRTPRRGRARRRASRARRASPGRCRRECPRVLAQRLFVEKAGLPSPLLNQIKRLAAFQNPEFYKKQSMRLSTATDAAGDRLRRGSAAARRAPAGLPSRARGAAARVTVSRSTSTTSAIAGEPLELRFHGHADARFRSRPRARSSRTTPACSSRRLASARPSSARTSSRRARCSTLDPGPPPAAARPVARAARRCSSASSRRRSARSAAGSAAPTAGSTWR